MKINPAAKLWAVFAVVVAFSQALKVDKSNFYRGKLLNWDRTNDVPKITVPTLVIGAKNDTMDPAHMEMMSKKVQKGRYLFCPNGSHMAFYGDRRLTWRD